MWVKKQQLELDMKQGTGFRLGEECDKGLYCRACVCAKFLQSCLTLCNLRTIARQALLSMGFPRQEYWSGLPFPSTGDLPNPRIKPRPPALKADSLPTELQGRSSCSQYLLSEGQAGAISPGQGARILKQRGKDPYPFAKDLNKGRKKCRVIQGHRDSRNRAKTNLPFSSFLLPKTLKSLGRRGSNSEEEN